jgi:hypothetical protein
MKAQDMKNQDVENEETGGCGGVCGRGGAEDEPVPELDVRGVPHALRHTTVFGALDAVPAGSAMVLIAPHDPLTLLAHRGTVGPQGRADRPPRRSAPSPHADQRPIRRYSVYYCNQHPWRCLHRRPPSRVLRTVRAGHRPAARLVCPDSRAAGYSLKALGRAA